MFRAALSLLVSSLLFMALGAAIVVAANFYAPRLLANVLPESLRPAPAKTAEMTPPKIVDGLTDIRGALE